ncbi:MAG: hypothetical protein QNK30_02370 [Bacteroidales bacterium]|nr:hypothetical protein [Bacteroidales bacterium]
MIKFGVLIDEKPLNEYLNQLSGKKPFEISGFFQPKASPNGPPTQLFGRKKVNSFDELIEKSDAILFLGGCVSDSERVIRATKRFKHIFLSEALNIEDESHFEMLKLAQEANIMVFTGNPLLFNPAYISLSKEIDRPFHIEIRRKNRPEFKSDNNIIRELVKDIEFLLSVIKANPKRIVPGTLGEVKNIPTMINTRIEFDNGASANLIYNFLHDEQKHYIHIYQHAKHFYIDFINLKTKIYQLGDSTRSRGNIIVQPEPYVQTNISKQETKNQNNSEIMAFYNSLTGNLEPKLSFEESIMALKLANKVMNRIMVAKDQFA